MICVSIFGRNIFLAVGPQYFRFSVTKHLCKRLVDISDLAVGSPRGNSNQSGLLQRAQLRFVCGPSRRFVALHCADAEPYQNSAYSDVDETFSCFESPKIQARTKEKMEEVVKRDHPNCRPNYKCDREAGGRGAIRQRKDKFMVHEAGLRQN